MSVLRAEPVTGPRTLTLDTFDHWIIDAFGIPHYRDLHTVVTYDLEPLVTWEDLATGLVVGGCGGITRAVLTLAAQEPWDGPVDHVIGLRIRAIRCGTLTGPNEWSLPVRWETEATQHGDRWSVTITDLDVPERAPFTVAASDLIAIARALEVRPLN